MENDKKRRRTSSALLDELRINTVFKVTGELEEAVPMVVSVADLIVSHQVREEFDDAENQIEELAASIKEHGLLQPIVVRPMQFGRYALVAGERRLRAVKLLGWLEIAARVREMTDVEAENIQFAENIQRKNLTQIEEAKKLQRDLDSLGSVEAVLAKHKKSHSWLSKTMNLLKLPEQARRLVIENISSDLEVINAVRTIEKINSPKAKEVVEALKNREQGTSDARRFVLQAKEQVKPSLKPLLAAEREKERRAVERTFVATPTDRSYLKPSAPVSIFPAKPVTPHGKLLNEAFAKIFSGAADPDAVADAFSDAEMEIVTKHLRRFFDKGRSSSNISRVLLAGLRKGIFGGDGEAAFASLALLQGVQQLPSFDFVAALHGIKPE